MWRGRKAGGGKESWLCANIVVGEGKNGLGCVLATLARESRLSGSACKNGTSRKSFKEEYSTVEVARQACTVFASSTSASVTKTPPGLFFPSSRNDCLHSCYLKSKSKKTPSLDEAPVSTSCYCYQIFCLLHKRFCYTGEHLSQRSACEALPSGAVSRRKKGRNLPELRSSYHFCGPGADSHLFLSRA